MTRLMTIRQVADAMSLSPFTVYRLVGAGRLPAVRIGRNVRIPEDRLSELVEAMTVTRRKK